MLRFSKINQSRILIMTCAVLILSGCINTAPISTPDRPTTLPAETEEHPQTTVPTPPIMTIPDNAAGPLLLFQTGLETYRILDIDALTFYPFNPPGNPTTHDLNWGLSPGGQNILFRMEEEEIVILNLTSGQVHNTNFLSSDSPLFQPEAAARACQNAFPDLTASIEDLSRELSAAYEQSRGMLTWFTDNQHLLMVDHCSETSTCLFLDAIETGQRTQLESMTGLVKGFWISPDGKRILLEKDCVFNPLKDLDDRYYVIEVSSHQMQEIPLPEDREQPLVGWITEGWIGITHQNRIAGSENFSLINVEDMQIIPIRKGLFDAVRYQQSSLFFLSRNDDPWKTTLARYTQMALLEQEIIIDGFCSWLSPSYYNEKLILNCETKAYLVDDSLKITEYFTPLALFAPAPDQQKAVVTAKNSSDVFLEQKQTGTPTQLALSDAPLEILWRPDSLGFLYRSLTDLYYYDLETSQETWMTGLNEIGDYTNLNAVWIP